VRRSDAGDGREVLDGNRQAGQHAAFVGRDCHETVGVISGLVEAAGRQRIDHGVDGLDPALHRVESVVGAEVARG